MSDTSYFLKRWARNFIGIVALVSGIGLVTWMLKAMFAAGGWWTVLGIVITLALLIGVATAIELSCEYAVRGRTWD